MCFSELCLTGFIDITSQQNRKNQNYGSTKDNSPLARIPSRPFEKLTNPRLNETNDHTLQNGFHKNNEENKFSQNYIGSYQNGYYKGQTNQPTSGKLIPDIKLKHGNSANAPLRVEKISPTKLGVATRTASTKPEDNKEGPPEPKRSRSFFRFFKIFNWG